MCNYNSHADNGQDFNSVYYQIIHICIILKYQNKSNGRNENKVAIVRSERSYLPCPIRDHSCIDVCPHIPHRAALAAFTAISVAVAAGVSTANTGSAQLLPERNLEGLASGSAVEVNDQERPSAVCLRLGPHFYLLLSLCSRRCRRKARAGQIQPAAGVAVPILVNSDGLPVGDDVPYPCHDSLVGQIKAKNQWGAYDRPGTYRQR